MVANYVFIYRRERPVMVKAVSGAVLIFALVRLLHSPLSSLVMGLGSIGLFSFRSGIEVNIPERKYRMVNMLGPQVFGTWEDLPELDYISLFKTNITFSASSLTTATISQTDTYIQVNLITEKKKKIKVYEGKDFNEALARAKQFSKDFQLDIWNATVRPADWYEEESN